MGIKFESQIHCYNIYSPTNKIGHRLTKFYMNNRFFLIVITYFVKSAPRKLKAASLSTGTEMTSLCWCAVKNLLSSSSDGLMKYFSWRRDGPRGLLRQEATAPSPRGRPQGDANILGLNCVNCGKNDFKILSVDLLITRWTWDAAIVAYVRLTRASVENTLNHCLPLHCSMISYLT